MILPLQPSSAGIACVYLHALIRLNSALVVGRNQFQLTLEVKRTFADPLMEEAR